MKANHWALALSLAAAFTVSTAKAGEVAYYASADTAMASCGAEEVVWIDLDRGRYYKKDHPEFGKGSNGAYACEHAAHAKYREGKPATEAVAKQ